MEKTIVAWSGGKDSALALYEARKTGRETISCLLTTVTGEYNRISMHGVREALVERQAESLGVYLEKVRIAPNSSHEEYDSKMKSFLVRCVLNGISSVIFGDIFLEDLRSYREMRLREVGLKGIFPLWKRSTTQLAREFISSGFRAIITCVDSHMLDKGFAGREFDENFLNAIPESVDPCGENGEFHTFVYDGPIFTKKISCVRGDIILRENRFCYCDLIPR